MTAAKPALGSAKKATYTVYGIHPVRILLERAPERVLHLWISKKRRDERLLELITLTGDMGIAIEWAAPETLDRLAEGGNHQGVVAQARLPKPLSAGDLFDQLRQPPREGGPPLYLVLDRVQDPHNLGACLRTADAVGVWGVITPKDRTVGLMPTVCRVACGATETIPLFRVTNLARTLKRLQEEGIWTVGADGHAEKLAFDTDLSGPLALVVGAEGEGLRRLVREQCDLLVRLPMRGAVESLNLSVAAGVLLYEVLRQRLATSRP